MSQTHASCKIVIRGSCDVSWADCVGDMLMQVQADEGTIRTTTLLGQPIDLSAFLGTLPTLIDLGFPVLAFEYRQIDEREASDGNGFDQAEPPV
jgi:hypothetical protein